MTQLFRELLLERLKVDVALLEMDGSIGGKDWYRLEVRVLCDDTLCVCSRGDLVESP